jgi:D-inositol-3-phosphate glycosyltransferase
MQRRIAIISEHASPLASLGSVDSGGQNVYVAHIARQLARIGYQVDVFTRHVERNSPVWQLWEDGVRVVHVPAGPARFVRKEDMFPYMPSFADWMTEHASQYDLYHANFWMSGYVAAELRRRLGRPFVITFHALGRVRRLHQGAADEFPAAREQVEQRLIDEAAMVVAECPQDVDDHVTLYGADRERIRLVPCGYDPAEFSPVDQLAARQRLGLSGDEPLFLQLGRIVPRKGIDNVIRAIGELNHRHRKAARLLVVGGQSPQSRRVVDPEMGRLQQVARECRVKNQVEFIGQRDREALKWFYSASDAFITTPWYEPFGITPLEAMACGKPVIGSNVGGIKYTVRHGVTGLLVPPKDPIALANAMQALLDDVKLRQSMGANALARVKRHFTWECVAHQLAAVYSEVLAAELTVRRPMTATACLEQVATEVAS